MFRHGMVAAALLILLPTVAQAIAPISQPRAVITQVAFACGPGMTRVNGICVARATIRQVRRCARWYGGACVQWY